MKWSHIPKERPAFGSCRLIVKLAIWPTACNKNHKHCLEFVLLRQWRGSECWWDQDIICPDSDEAKEFLKT